MAEDPAGPRGISSIALTYTNNDYGKGLAGRHQDLFRGRQADRSDNLVAAHEDGKGDYSAEVGRAGLGRWRHSGGCRAISIRVAWGSSSPRSTAAPLTRSACRAV